MVLWCSAYGVGGAGDCGQVVQSRRERRALEFEHSVAASIIYHSSFKLFYVLPARLPLLLAR